MGTRSMRHSSGRVQRPECLRNSKATRFKSQETLWGLEGMVQGGSTCLACTRPFYLKNRKCLKPNSKDTVCGGAGQTIELGSSLKTCWV